MKLKEFLKTKLSKKEYAIVPSSFDIVGDIAIFIDFPKELNKKEKLIGNSLLKLHKNLRVVCKKTRKYSGVYRTAKLKIIAGEKRKETIYVENGIRLALDVEKVYFSGRLGTERKRITDLAKKKESVLVMFSGCGPYTCQLAKKVSKVTAVEINPIAHKYALKNLELNKIKNATVLKGDIKKVKIKGKFDRIVMPLPKTADKFLKRAISLSKKGTVIHFYAIAKESEFKDVKKKIKDICPKCRILRVVKAGEYAPRTFRICVDIKLTK